MPVTIKTPACPVVVAPPAPDARGDWIIEADGQGVKSEFRDSEGRLLGFALTGDATREKMALQKELPSILP
jgi:rubredoxin-NAD+ reductase